MRTDEFPFLTDWIAISFRWLGIIAVVASLTFSNDWIMPENGVILTLGLWNIIVTFLAMLNKRLPGHRFINISIDVIACSFLFILTEGFTGPLFWVGVLPLFSAAIYFEWWGILAAVILTSLLASLWAYIFIDINSYLIPMIAVILSEAILGVILGFLSRFLLNKTRNIYRKKVSNRLEVINSSRRLERKRMKAFFELIETLSGTLDYNVVLDTALELCINTQDHSSTSAKPTAMACAFLLFNDSYLRITASRGFPPRDSRISLPGREGAIYESLRHGESRLITNPTEEPELKQLIVVQKYPQVLCLPLIRSLDVFGILIICHPSRKFFTADRIELFELISHQATIALQNARLFHELEVEKEHIIETQDEIRKELARELHDGPTQSVAAIAMRSSVAKQLLDQDLEEARKELNSIETLARSTTNEIRHMLFTLRPLVLETEGLYAALMTMAEKMKDTFHQQVVVNANSDVIEKLEPSKQTVIFYIAEEAVNNARKHAQADQIQVSLNFVSIDKRMAILDIQDNGVGFDMPDIVQSYENRGSLGLLNLQERTDLINGLLRIDSKAGKGTRVRVYIPLTKEAIDLLQQNKNAKDHTPILVEK